MKTAHFHSVMRRGFLDFLGESVQESLPSSRDFSMRGSRIPLLYLE